jgi:hypothetical protein
MRCVVDPRRVGPGRDRNHGVPDVVQAKAWSGWSSCGEGRRGDRLTCGGAGCAGSVPGADCGGRVRRGTYGPWAFGTNACSGLSDWPGGGVIGIRGTNQPYLIPGWPSHGCIRVANRPIRRLRAPDADRHAGADPVSTWLLRPTPRGPPVRSQRASSSTPCVPPNRKSVGRASAGSTSPIVGIDHRPVRAAGRADP